MRIARTAAAPAAGAVFFTFWVVAEAGRMSLDAVGGRFVVVVWVAVLGTVALAIALVRLLPVASLVLLSAVIVVQSVWWPAQFTQNSWPVYFGFALVVAGLSLVTEGRMRRVALAASGVWTFAVTAMLTIPGTQSLVFERSIGAGPGTVLRNYVAVLAVATAVLLGAWTAGIVARRAMRREERADGVPAEIEGLSERESAVFHLAAEGRSNADIARALFVSEATVKSHMSSILAKLGLSSRAQLVAYAWSRGLVVSPVG